MANKKGETEIYYGASKLCKGADERKAIKKAIQKKEVVINSDGTVTIKNNG